MALGNCRGKKINTVFIYKSLLMSHMQVSDSSAGACLPYTFLTVVDIKLGSVVGRIRWTPMTLDFVPF